MLNIFKRLLYFFIIAQVILIGCSHSKLKKPVLSEYGTLTVNAIPWGEVYIDEGKIDQDGPETPIINYPISEGKHVIEVKRKGFGPYKKEIQATKGEHYTYSANLPILFNKVNFAFHLIYGVEDIETMQKVTLIIGPEILEEVYYPNIIKYIKGFGEVDTVLLYSYSKNVPIKKISANLKSNISRLIKYSKNDLNISYFNRYMKTEEEIDELRKIMEFYEKRKKLEYKGSCVFEQPG